jgi:hypothetical protein
MSLSKGDIFVFLQARHEWVTIMPLITTKG